MRKILSLLSLAALLFVAACEEVVIPASIDIPQDSQEYFYKGISFSATSAEGALTVKISFTSSVNWSATIQDAEGKSVSWLTASPMSGSAGDTEITVTAQENKSGEARTAKITVTCDDITKTINVTQAAFVEVTEVSLGSRELEIEAGESATLTATVLPDNATDKTVTWSSSDTSVATVKDGKVTGVDVGEAIVTAKAGGKEATCKVIVTPPVVAVEYVDLNKTKLELVPGESEQITATVLPYNATDQTVTWSSSNTKIATVEDGLVTAVSIGEATITATAGNQKGECTVTVLDPSVMRAVDLGLNVKWGSMNLGASAPEDYGDYYAWGETEPYYSSLDPLTWKEDKPNGYDVTSYKWCNGNYKKLTKYCPTNKKDYWDGDGDPDGKTTLDPEDDAAHVQLGGNWRMPTDYDWTSLRTNCTWKWTNNYNGTGVAGMTITSKKNGKSIFLPGAGYRLGTKEEVSYLGSRAYYWSTLDPDYPNSAYYRYSSSGYDARQSEQRYYGLSVRPVLDR